MHTYFCRQVIARSLSRANMCPEGGEGEEITAREQTNFALSLLSVIQCLALIEHHLRLSIGTPSYSDASFRLNRHGRCHTSDLVNLATAFNELLPMFYQRNTY
jgi:hypothetical protein